MTADQIKKNAEEAAQKYNDEWTKTQAVFYNGDTLVRAKHFICGHIAGAESRQAEIDELKAEITRLQGEVVKRNQYKINQEKLDNVHEHYEGIEKSYKKLLKLVEENKALRDAKLEALEALGESMCDALKSARGQDYVGMESYAGIQRLVEKWGERNE